MRGWFTVLTKEKGLSSYRTGILVASAEPELVKLTADHIQSSFPGLDLSFLAPSQYSEFLAGRGQTLWTDGLKAHPARSLRSLRQLSFDLVFVLLAGRPTFRKAKLAAFVLNPRRIIIYTEDGNSIVVDRAHWKAILRLLGNRSRFYRFGSVLFIPIGFLYLAGRTIWLCKRGREADVRARAKDDSTVRPTTGSA
jgi:hypothetical protein